MKNVLALDVGGTAIKAAVFADGRPVRRFDPEPSCSAGTLEDIRGAFGRVILAAGPVRGIGVAMPGPFDMRTGLSAMTEKFGALYGKRLPDVLGRNDLKFIQDATAFLLGEMRRGRVGKFRRVGGITLGTGIGSAAAIDGRPLLNAELRPVAEHALWKRPFRGGTVEDRISARGILARFPEAGSVRRIGELADSGDARALAVWREVGEELAEVLSAWIAELSLEHVVIGGRIARSFRHFAGPLAKLPVAPGDLDGDSPLYAAAALFDPERPLELAENDPKIGV